MKQLLGFFVSALLLAACSTVSAASEPALSERPIRVTTTVGMIADIVKNVGGARVQVTGLMGPGVDPHLYKPTASDVQKLEQADVIFYGGLELEGRMTETFEKLAASGQPTFAVSADIDPARLRQPVEFEGRYDPHLWFDVTLWQEAVRKVERELQGLDPAHAAEYAANAAAYQQQLAELDAYIRQQAASVPEATRVLITAHDAFGYFGEQYGFEVRGLQGTSTATEASAADVRALAEFVCARGIKAIFIESSVPVATIEAVQAAARDRGCTVDIPGPLFSDALGNPGAPEGTYVGMVRYNVDTIVGALR